MIRTQIQLTDEQARALKHVAAERGVSIAAVIRDAVDEIVANADRERRWELAKSVIGKYSDPTASDVSQTHDHHVAEAYLDWRS